MIKVKVKVFQIGHSRLWIKVFWPNFDQVKSRPWSRLDLLPSLNIIRQTIDRYKINKWHIKMNERQCNKKKFTFWDKTTFKMLNFYGQDFLKNQGQGQGFSNWPFKVLNQGFLAKFRPSQVKALIKASTCFRLYWILLSYTTFGTYLLCC